MASHNASRRRAVSGDKKPSTESPATIAEPDPQNELLESFRRVRDLEKARIVTLDVDGATVYGFATRLELLGDDRKRTRIVDTLVRLRQGSWVLLGYAVGSNGDRLGIPAITELSKRDVFAWWTNEFPEPERLRPLPPEFEKFGKFEPTIAPSGATYHVQTASLPPGVSLDGLWAANGGVFQLPAKKSRLGKSGRKPDPQRDEQIRKALDDDHESLQTVAHRFRFKTKGGASKAAKRARKAKPR